MVNDVKLGEQPRYKCFSHTSKWGADHVKWSDLAGHADAHPAVTSARTQR